MTSWINSHSNYPIHKSPQWFCVSTFGKLQVEVTQAINALGEMMMTQDVSLEIIAYCPMDQYETRPRGRRKLPPEEQVVVVRRPMLGGYIFVKMLGTDEQWSHVRGQRGYYNVLCNHDVPVRIPDALITELRLLENDLLPHAPIIDKSIKVGSQVTIVRGEWKGNEVPVKAIEGVIATVQVTLFGKDLPLKVPLSFLTMAAKKPLAIASQVAYA